MVNVNNQSPGLKALSHQYPEMDIGHVPPCSMLPLAHQVAFVLFTRETLELFSLQGGQAGNYLLDSTPWFGYVGLVWFPSETGSHLARDGLKQAMQPRLSF